MFTHQFPGDLTGRDQENMCLVSPPIDTARFKEWNLDINFLGRHNFGPWNQEFRAFKEALEAHGYKIKFIPLYDIDMDQTNLRMIASYAHHQGVDPLFTKPGSLSNPTQQQTSRAA